MWFSFLLNISDGRRCRVRVHLGVESATCAPLSTRESAGASCRDLANHRIICCPGLHHHSYVIAFYVFELLLIIPDGLSIPFFSVGRRGTMTFSRTLTGGIGQPDWLVWIRRGPPTVPSGPVATTLDLELAPTPAVVTDTTKTTTDTEGVEVITV
jgi:hypothetical protein